MIDLLHMKATVSPVIFSKPRIPSFPLAMIEGGFGLHTLKNSPIPVLESY